jgi:hypothetical protein
MRYMFFTPMIFLLILSSCSQSKMEMSNEIKELSIKVDSLSSKVDELTVQNKTQEEEISWIESEMGEISKLKKMKIETPVAAPVSKVTEKETVDWQCKAITNSGSRCSRAAVKGSKYCWQHKKTYEPDNPDQKVNSAETVPNDKKK